MRETDVYDRLKKFINEDVPFARHCGVEVSNLQQGGATATLPSEPTLLNHVGTQHAGALFAVAESASGACMLGLIGKQFEAITPLVRNATISYRRPARGLITATAHSDTERSAVYDELSREGRCDFSVNVELRDETGDVVATATMAWHIRTRGPA